MPLGQENGSLAFKQNLSDAKNCCLTASFEFEASNLHAVPVAVKMSAALRFGFERALLHAVWLDVSNVSNSLDSAMIRFRVLQYFKVLSALYLYVNIIFSCSMAFNMSWSWPSELGRILKWLWLRLRRIIHASWPSMHLALRWNSYTKQHYLQSDLADPFTYPSTNPTI